MEIDKTIKIWAFDDAPEEYKNLSKNGGDEDWLAYVPVYYATEYSPIPFFLDDESFGCCSVDQYKVIKKGKRIGTVVIGCHA